MQHEHNDPGTSNHGKPPKGYHILVDHRPHDWPNPVITGMEVKQLAGVDALTFEVWQDVSGPDDKFIADTDRVDLTENGTEKFFTIKKTTTEG